MTRGLPRRFGPVNWRGFWTLYSRGVRRHGKGWRDSIAGPCVSSLLFLTVFMLARSQDAGAPWPGLDLASFIAPGLVAFAFCHAAFEAMGAYLIYDKMEGMIQDLLAAPLTPLELLAGMALGAATAGLITGSAVLLVFLPFVAWPTLQPLTLLGFAAAGALLFALVGFLVGLWARKWDHYSAAESFLMLPLGLLSGTFFLRGELPPVGAEILLGNPVFHVIDGFRAGLLGRSDGDPVLGALLLTFVLLSLGLVAWRLVVRGWHLKP